MRPLIIVLHTLFFGLMAGGVFLALWGLAAAFGVAEYVWPLSVVALLVTLPFHLTLPASAHRSVLTLLLLLTGVYLLLLLSIPTVPAALGSMVLAAVGTYSLFVAAARRQVRSLPAV